jgi:aconitase B
MRANKFILTDDKRALIEQLRRERSIFTAMISESMEKKLMCERAMKEIDDYIEKLIQITKEEDEQNAIHSTEN